MVGFAYYVADLLADTMVFTCLKAIISVWMARGHGMYYFFSFTGSFTCRLRSNAPEYRGDCRQSVQRGNRAQSHETIPLFKDDLIGLSYHCFMSLKLLGREGSQLLHTRLRCEGFRSTWSLRWFIYLHGPAGFFSYAWFEYDLRVRSPASGKLILWTKLWLLPWLNKLSTVSSFVSFGDTYWDMCSKSEFAEKWWYHVARIVVVGHVNIMRCFKRLGFHHLLGWYWIRFHLNAVCMKEKAQEESFIHAGWRGGRDQCNSGNIYLSYLILARSSPTLNSDERCAAMT